MKLPELHKRNSASRRAFTLVEVMVVVAIVALLLAIAGTMLGRNDTGTATRSAARDLRLVVESAQARALSSGNEVAVLVANDSSDPDRFLRFVLVVERADVSANGTGGTWQALGNGIFLPASAFYYPQVSHNETFESDGASFSPFGTASALKGYNNPSKWIGLTFNSQGQPMVRGGNAGNPFMIVGTGETGTSGLDATPDDKLKSEGFMILRSNGRLIALESAYDQHVASAAP